jgi:RND family efflux transporter MFP subunit
MEVTMQVGRVRWAAPIAGLALGVAAAIGSGCATPARAAGEPAAPKVAVVAAEHRDIALESAYTGRVEAVHTVELRPRVSGALEAVMFREGGYVERNTPLFRIDQRPYTIALQRAQADAATIAAQLARAKDEFARADRLVASDAISVEEMERRRSEVATLESRLEVARAQVNDAALNLDFTTVRAPVSGKIGRAEVTIGNLVNGSGGDGTRLAVLHSTDPVYVYFELDPLTASAAAQQPRSAWRADVTPFDGGTPISGPIDFIDNGVGAETGTLRVRARLANRAGRLLPGSVVKVGFQYGIARGSIVVPEIAIGADQGGRYVLVASSAGLVEYRPVTPAAKAGAWRAVNDVIRKGDRIVLPGMPGLRPGMKVQPVDEVMQ